MSTIYDVSSENSPNRLHVALMSQANLRLLIKTQWAFFFKNSSFKSWSVAGLKGGLQNEYANVFFLCYLN